MNHNLRIITIVLIIILFGIFFIYVIEENKVQEKTNIECATDYDCVPATCCHATNCISKFEAQNCTGILCTANCQTLLDCNKGKCSCINGKCNATKRDII